MLNIELILDKNYLAPECTSCCCGSVLLSFSPIKLWCWLPMIYDGISLKSIKGCSAEVLFTVGYFTFTFYCLFSSGGKYILPLPCLFYSLSSPIKGIWEVRERERQSNPRQCKFMFKGYLQIIKCNLFCNFKTPYSRKDCLSNHVESWFGQPVPRVHNWDAFILSWNKMEYSQQTRWLTDKFKQVSWLEISASNFNYNMWSIYKITEGKCLPDSQPLFEIAFQQM